MIPEITFFGFPVETYTLMAALAAVTFAAMSFWPLRRCGLPLWSVIILLVLISAAFLVGARLWNVAVNPDSYGENRPWYTLRMTGFSMYGGIAGAMTVLLFTALIARIRPMKILDAATIPGAAAFCTARIGCFLSGCCAGKETDLPWGVRFPVDSDGLTSAVIHTPAVHPTQLYELVLALLGIPLCLLLVKKLRPGSGGRFFLYAAWFSTMRLVVHPLRVFPYSPLVTNIVYPLLYYVLIVHAVFLFIAACRKNRRIGERKEL